MFFQRTENVRFLTLEARRLHRRRRIFDALVRVMYATVSIALFGVGLEARTWLLHTPRFGLKTFEVTGNHAASQWEIRILAGITPGINVLALDLDDLVRKIRRHPWIQEARVRRVLPDRLEAQITERHPAVLVSVDALYYADAEGMIFKKVQPGESLAFPVITGFERPGILQSRRVGKMALDEALILLGKIPQKTRISPDQISEIHLDPLYGFSVYTTLGLAKVQLGWSPFDVKLERLEKLLSGQRLNLAQVKHLNLDLQRTAVVTPL